MLRIETVAEVKRLLTPTPYLDSSLSRIWSRERGTKREPSSLGRIR